MEKPTTEQDKVALTNLVIEMAWCDKTSFEKIKQKTGFSESETINIMRQNLKPNSFKRWRQRVSGRPAKHERLLRSNSDLEQDEEK